MNPYCIDCGALLLSSSWPQLCRRCAGPSLSAQDREDLRAVEEFEQRFRQVRRQVDAYRA
jgi:hypothetical protein